MFSSWSRMSLEELVEGGVVGSYFQLGAVGEEGAAESGWATFGNRKRRRIAELIGDAQGAKSGAGAAAAAGETD